MLSTFIKLRFVIEIVLSLFEWPLKTGFTVFSKEREEWVNIDFSITEMVPH